MSVELTFTASVKGTPKSRIECDIYEAEQALIESEKRMIALACDTAQDFVSELGEVVPRHKHVINEIGLYVMQYHEAATRLTLLEQARCADDLEEDM